MAFAQQTVISGKVAEQNGSPLPGVTVVFKGTTIGTVTNIDGDFTLNQPEGQSILTFSFIGMKTMDINISGKTTINVVMEAETIGLEEVVAIGYGIAKKGDLTGAVTTVSTADFDKVPATSPLQALQGRASGIQITSNSGMPGAGGSVLIRGTQSINGSNSPIYVVDGVITDGIDNLNPNNIESVSVLKDASASAIYGARAANGVVLVTTKRGNGKREPEITLNAYYGVQTESNLKLDLLNADEFVELWTETYTNSGLDIPWDNETLSYYEGVDTDWRDHVMQTGIIQSYDLSVSGGSEKSNYFISAGYLDQKGMVIETGHEKYTLTFNSDHKIGERIKFGNSLNIYSTKTDGGAKPYTTALTKVPLTRAYEDDGDYGKVFNTGLEHMFANPVWLAKNNIEERKNKGLQGSLYLTLNILEGLDFTARGSMDYSNAYDSEFLSGVPPHYGWEGTNINSVSKRYNENVHWIGDFLLNYEKTFNEVHKIKALVGYSVEESNTEYLEGSRTGTPNDDIRFLDAGDPLSQLNGNGFTDWSFASLFGRLNYTYNNKYLITATVRRDGTSRLAEGNKYGIFPSGSIAWRMSEEEFMREAGFIDDLKIRASYGTLGNILSVGPYGTISSLSSRKAVVNQGGAQAYTLTSAVNSDLQWESASKMNFGLDATMFNSRLYTTLNFFIEDTYDLLFSDPIAASTGLSGSPLINAGEVRNTGFEWELGYRVQQNDWSYDVNFNLSHVVNEVSNLDGRDLRTSGLVEGYPVRSFFGYKSNGIITDASQLDVYQEGSFTKKQVGDIALLDIDGYDADGNLIGKADGKVDAADRTLIGKKYPDLTYGAMGTVSYKNWSLQMQLQGVQGVDFYYGPNKYDDLITLMTSSAQNQDARVLQRYDAINNPNGTWPRLSKNQTGSNDQVSEFWLEDASYLRVKNVNLNYNLPKEYCGKVGMSNLGIYVSVQNAFTFTKFSGPEVDTSSDPLTGIPQARTWTMGIKATF
jgi:TonB-linked SusC/RagA family outer membrane protein